jgi:hypothetical protein
MFASRRKEPPPSAHRFNSFWDIADTSDFATAKQANCDGYQLTLQRLQVDGRDVWQGQFSRAEQRLTVIASLE